MENEQKEISERLMLLIEYVRDIRKGYISVLELAEINFQIYKDGKYKNKEKPKALSENSQFTEMRRDYDKYVDQLQAIRELLNANTHTLESSKIREFPPQVLSHFLQELKTGFESVVSYQENAKHHIENSAVLYMKSTELPTKGQYLHLKGICLIAEAFTKLTIDVNILIQELRNIDIQLEQLKMKDKKFNEAYIARLSRNTKLGYPQEKMIAQIKELEQEINTWDTADRLCNDKDENDGMDESGVTNTEEA